MFTLKPNNDITTKYTYLGVKTHLQKVQDDRVFFQEEAKQWHPLANKLHYPLLDVENIGSLFLLWALCKLCLVSAVSVKGITYKTLLTK